MHAFREESEQHVVHRLEAFSDIVIGFSLAQLTYNLVLPLDILTLFTKNWQSLVAFGLTFFVVSTMWWAHHRLFTHYFVPTPFNIFLNFASLGGVIFLIYSLELWLHSKYHHNLGFALYCGSLGAVVGILAFLLWRGTVLRGHRMDPGLVRRGKWRALRMAWISAVFVVMAILNVVAASREAILSSLVFVAMFGALGIRVLERRARARNAAEPVVR